MNRVMHEIEPEEVMAYLDGELEAARASEVAAHLASCAECSKVAEDLRGMATKFSAWPVEPCGIAVEKLLKAGAGEPRPRTRRPSRVARLVRWLWNSPVPWRIAAIGAGGIACLFLLMETPSYFLRRAARSSHDEMSTEFTSNEIAQLQQRREQEALSSNLERDSGSLGNLRTEPAPAPAPDSNGLHHGLGDHAANSFSVNGQPASDQQSKVFANEALSPSGPMIARTAEITLVVTKLDDSHGALEKVLARHHGFASDMNVDKSNAASPSLSATLQVPASELDAVVAELRGLGRVTTESQRGEDVSDQHVDLTARLHNARETEQRLLEILRTRTGKVGDVLAVEEQISQTRGQIEQMEAQLENLEKRVSYASIKLQMGEEYKEPAGASNGVGLRLRNSIVGGYRDAVESLISLVAFLFSAGPTLLLWGALLFWPARAIWRRRGALRSVFAKEAVR